MNKSTCGLKIALVKSAYGLGGHTGVNDDQ